MWILLGLACSRSTAPVPVEERDLTALQRSAWGLTQLVDDTNVDITVFGGTTDDMALAVAGVSATEVWIGGSTVSTVAPNSDQAFACHETSTVSECANFPTAAAVFGPNIGILGNDDDAVRDMAMLGSDVLMVGTTGLGRAFNGPFDAPCTTTGQGLDAWVATLIGGTVDCRLQGENIGKDEGLTMAIGKDAAGVPAFAFTAFRAPHPAGGGGANASDIAVLAFDLSMGGVTKVASTTIVTDLDSAVPPIFTFDEPMDIAVRFDGDNYNVYVAGTTGGDAANAGFPVVYGSDKGNWDGLVAQIKFITQPPQFQKDWIFQFGTESQDNAQGVAIEDERMVVTGRFSEDETDTDCGGVGTPKKAFGDAYVLYMELDSTDDWFPKLDANGEIPYSANIRGDCGKGDVGSAVDIKDGTIAVIGTLGGGKDHTAPIPGEEGFLLSYDIIADPGPDYIETLGPLIQQYKISGKAGCSPACFNSTDRPTALTFKGSRLHLVGWTLSDLMGTLGGVGPTSRDAFWIDLANTVL